MRIALRAALMLVIAAPAFLSTTASAQEIEDGTITVVQPKPLLRRHRVELAPRFSVQLNDPYIQQFAVGGNLNYNVSERLSIGAAFDWFDFGPSFGGTTGAFDEVIETTSRVPEYVQLDWYAGLDFNFIPVYGKFDLFRRSIVYWDLYLTIGGGVAHNGTDISPGGTLAIGVHTYFNRWLGVYFEYRDRLSIQELDTRTVLWNMGTAGVGFSIFLPAGFNYTYQQEEGR